MTNRSPQTINAAMSWWIRDALRRLFRRPRPERGDQPLTIRRIRTNGLPHTNPARDAKSLRSGRLRKELRP